jgi:hypothetical protein
VEENVRINITGDNRDALKKLDKVEQAVNRLNSAASQVEVRVANIKQTQTQVDRLYQSLQRLENVTLSKLPQSLQTVIVYLKAANRGMAELTARTATAVALVKQLGVIDFTPTIKQLTAANDRIDELIRKRRFLEGQVKAIDTRVERGRIKKPEAIERARKEQELLRESVRKLNAEIDTYNSKALTSYRKQSSALRSLRGEYDAVRKALVSLRIEQARVFAVDQKRLRQQGDITGTPQRKALPSTGALARPLERALRSLTEVIYVTVGRMRRIFDSSRLLPAGRKALPKAGELAVNNFNRSLQDLTKIIYVTVGQIARIWASSRLLPPQARLSPAASPALGAGMGQTGYPGASRLALTSAGGGFVPPGGRNPNPYRGPGGALGPQLRPNNVIVPNNIRGLEAFRAFLVSLVKTAEIGSPAFNRYAKALGNVNKDIAKANIQIDKAQADPKTIAGKKAESEALQASLEQAEIGSENFNELANKLRKVNAELEKTDKRTSGRGLGSRSRGRVLGDAASGAILGGGFPLLTGGPSFSAAGGGILGGLGGASFGATGGFAGGIAGSAIGAAVDTFVQKAQDLGKALLDPTNNIDALVQSLGILGTATGSLISELQGLGASEIAGAVAAEELQARLSGLGIDSEKLKKDSTNINNALQALQLTFTSWAAKFLPLIQSVTRFFGGAAGGGSAAQDAVQGSVTASGQLSQAELAKNQIIKDRLDVEKQIVANKRVETSIDSIQRAILEGNLNLQKNSAELDKLQLRRAFETNGAKQRLLDSEINITKQKRIQLDLDREAAIERARNQTVTSIIGQNITEQSITAQQTQALANNLRRDLTFTGTRNIFRVDEDVVLFDELKAAIEETSKAREDALYEQIRITSEALNMNETLREATISRLKEEIVLNGILSVAKLRDLSAEEGRALAAKNRFDSELKLQGILKEQELEAMQLTSPAALFSNAGQGIGFFQDSVTLANQLTLEYAHNIERLSVQIESLKEQERLLSDTRDRENMQRQITALEHTKQKYQQLAPAINQAKLEQQQFNDALALTTPIVSSFINGISEVVQGTKSAQEAFADFLRTIGDTLVQEGTRMIATYIAIGIAKAFAGLGGGSGPDPFSSNVASVLPDTGNLADIAAATPLRASGGPVERNRTYMVGEQGPELFTPNQAGRISSTSETRSLLGRSPIGNAPAMNFTFETTNIGGQEFVSREQLEAAMAVTRRQAANDGANRGMSMTLDKMQHSPATRRRVGIS